MEPAKKSYFCLVFSAVIATAPLASSGCGSTREPHTARLEQTRAQLLSDAEPDTLVVFVAHHRMWVMGSPVARLNEGRVSGSDMRGGLVVPLMEALRAEASSKGEQVGRVVIYVAEGVPRKTLAAIRRSVTSSRVGPGMILPWELAIEAQREEIEQKTESEGTTTEPSKGALPKGFEKFPIVVRATRSAVWLNGKLIGRLEGGRMPLKGARGGKSGFELPNLQERFSEAVSKLPMQRWRLLLVVTPEVERSVVVRLLSAAGQVGITKFKLYRTLRGDGK